MFELLHGHIMILCFIFCFSNRLLGTFHWVGWTQNIYWWDFKGIKTDLKEAKDTWLWNCTALCRCSSCFFETSSDASMKVIINKEEHISWEDKYIHTKNDNHNIRQFKMCLKKGTIIYSLRNQTGMIPVNWSIQRSLPGIKAPWGADGIQTYREEAARSCSAIWIHSIPGLPSQLVPWPMHEQ